MVLPPILFGVSASYNKYHAAGVSCNSMAFLKFGHSTYRAPYSLYPSSLLSTPMCGGRPGHGYLLVWLWPAIDAKVRSTPRAGLPLAKWVGTSDLHGTECQDPSLRPFKLYTMRRYSI